ncbi:MAG: methylmalonyl-CoA mutase [Candidatus Lokiarchaeota archaeon]|nr:methylmalonyl-CoA mutase [Candidatus Lokiarchaeota archaeon]MBD3339154.1 methylmalonyl-CoA mutase [Candidatus Lokiarchaeota archaeon]
MFSDEELKKIREKRIEWEEKELAKYVKRGERKENFETPSKIPLKQVYGPEDISEVNYLEELSYPGIPPFTRGVYPTMYRGRLWTMRQYSGFGDAKKTNERFKYLISQGQKGLSIAFDLPTQMGYNSDNQLCLGEVGRVGVTINSLKDFEEVFEGIPLDKVSTSMTINAPTAILLAMYIALGEKQGVQYEQLTGTVQNDVLKEYVARGTYIYPPKPSLRLVADVIEYCSENLPRFNTISISGYHMREAGCTAVQEIAFTLADGVSYINEVINRGIDIDAFAPRLSFFFTAQNYFFEEIAKFRAARRLWAKIVKERFKAQNPNSLKLRFHTQTAGVSLTAQQPKVNIIRVTLQALAAVLGGTQSLHTCGFDEALAIPTEESVRLSLRTQQILAHESGVGDVADPIGGSYYIEYLTSKLEQEAMDYIQKIDDMGGMTVAIEKGYIQDEIQKSAYNHQKRIDQGKDKVIGVNIYRTEKDTQIDTFKLDKNIEKRALESLEMVKRSRNTQEVAEALKELKEVAESSENIMPVIIKAVKAYATIQEICDVLRDVFGVYKSSQKI